MAVRRWVVPFWKGGCQVLGGVAVEDVGGPVCGVTERLGVGVEGSEAGEGAVDGVACMGVGCGGGAQVEQGGGDGGGSGKTEAGDRIVTVHGVMAG